MKKIIILIFYSFILISCTTAPSKEEMMYAYYGDYPVNYKEIVENYMSIRLKDPMSVRYRYLDGPVEAWYGASPYNKYGYSLCVYINAKNSFGGYTGPKLNYFMINTGINTGPIIVHNHSEYNVERLCSPLQQ